MREILVIDSECPRPYDPRTLASEALGGTEATIIRVMERLTEAAGVRIVVAQHCRRVAERHGAEYIPWPARWDTLDPDSVIVVRNPLNALAARQAFPRARLLYWTQDLFNRLSWESRGMLARAAPALVTVSAFHERAAAAFLDRAEIELPERFVIPNPIDDGLSPEERPYDGDQLVFLSAPEKGLAETLRCFERLCELDGRFRLVVANPGYSMTSLPYPARVEVVGPQPHARVVELLRTSLAVFYPNVTYPETFGLIYAEANAVGTPVLAHDLGAAAEVLCGDGQIVDCRDADAVASTIIAWRDGARPRVMARSAFRLAAVADLWRHALRL